MVKKYKYLITATDKQGKIMIESKSYTKVKAEEKRRRYTRRVGVYKVVIIPLK